MKKLLLLFLVVTTAYSCKDEESEEQDRYTGRELEYHLIKGSEYPIEGKVTFKELTDGGVEAMVKLTGTDGDAYHPVHFHYGDISTKDAEIAALLNDLSSETGESTTVLRRLSDESTINFDKLKEFNGSIRVHLAASGEGRDVVLAGGNVGLNESLPNQKIAVCQSE